MENLLSNLKVTVPQKIFKKDPETSDLGRRILGHGVLLIDEIGFEAFTFKKLGQRIGSNESSIYRYFESKHNLLIYLTSWYWAWMEYQLVLETYGMPKPEDKLKKGIEIVTRRVREDVRNTHINEEILYRIIVNENSKSFLTKEVDQENKDGYFEAYKRIITRLKDMIVAVDPNYAHPTSLASTLMEGALHQHFLRDHFKSITDCDKEITPNAFFTNLIFKVLS